MGFVVYGHDDSPVVPLMLFMPAKIGGKLHHFVLPNTKRASTLLEVSIDLIWAFFMPFLYNRVQLSQFNAF